MKWQVFCWSYFALQLVMRAMVGSVFGPPTMDEVWIMLAKSLALTGIVYTVYTAGVWLYRQITSKAVGAVRDAPYTAGRAVSTIERTASDAAAAFKAGRER